MTSYHKLSGLKLRIYLKVLEVSSLSGLKSRCYQGSRGKSFWLPFLTFLAHGSFLHLWSQEHNVITSPWLLLLPLIHGFLWLWPSCLSLICWINFISLCFSKKLAILCKLLNLLWLHWTNLDNPLPKILSLITSVRSLLPCKVTYS